MERKNKLCIDCKKLKKTSRGLRCYSCAAKYKIVVNGNSRAGKKNSPDTIQKMSDARTRYYDRVGRKEEYRNKHVGGDYEKWRSKVFIRDNFTCVICGSIGGYLEAHHIKKWSKFPESRFVVDNGVTLCKIPCHYKLHHIGSVTPLTSKHE